MAYDLRLLGRFQLASPSGEPIAVSAKKTQALIAVLALAGGAPVPRGKLTGLLWAERGEEQARSGLRQAFTARRKACGAADGFPFTVDDDMAAIDLAAIEVDVGRFAELAGKADAAARDAAIGLWRGELLEGLAVADPAVQDWLRDDRQRLRALYTQTLSRQVAEQEDAGDHGEALALAQRLLDADPLDEGAHRAVMRAHMRAGERTKALRQYQTCREVLERDLGVGPEAATESLHQQLLASEGDGAPQGTPEIAADKPSIAVLPFENLSGDPGQDYFADGITEDIIINLSRFRDLFVIASHSSFAYKGKAAKIQDVSRELGVRYVLEGSVQRSDDRVRITAQLVDGATGRHLWAERYQRRLADIFALQDEVTELIVGTLATGFGGRLRKAWQRRGERRSPETFQAFDCFMRGMDLFDHWTKEGIELGRACFEEAIRLDPNYAKAHAKLAWSHIVDAVDGWSADYEGSMAQGLEMATKSIACDDSESWGHWALAGYHIYTMRHDLALAELERAVDLNPNDADVLTDVGFCLTYAGRAEEALETAQKAMRLNPHFPEWYLGQSVQIHHDARQYEAALAACGRLRSFETTVLRLYQAACAAALGRDGEAKAAIERVLELDPEASLEKWTSPKMAPYKEPADLDHFRQNLRKARLPD